MSVAISWANKMQLAKCDIMVGFPISSHIYISRYYQVVNIKIISIVSMLYALTVSLLEYIDYPT